MVSTYCDGRGKCSSVLDSVLQQKSAQAKTAISSGFNIMLLLGAAIDRFVSRMQASILAAGAMALRVLASFTKTGRRQLSTARLQASESFKQSSAGKKIEQWSKSTEGFKQELPDVRLLLYIIY